MIVFRLFNCALLFLLQIEGYTQKSQTLLKVPTETKFANSGEYNLLNNKLLYLGIDLDDGDKAMTNVSVRMRNMMTGDDEIIQGNTFLPSIGWIDSTRVLLEFGISEDDNFLFGDWKRYLVSYNVFTHEQDTLPSEWYTSSNLVDNFLVSNGKLFYTIAYGSENMKNTYWIEYSINKEESRIIKKHPQNSFSILTYQYLPNTNELAYIKSEGKTKTLVRLSLSTGREKLVKAISDHNDIEEPSLVVRSKFFFVERMLRRGESENGKWNSNKYFLKTIDLESGLESNVITSENEITGISPYKGDQILLSMEIDSRESNVEKSFDLKSGGQVKVGLDFGSHLYILNLDS